MFDAKAKKYINHAKTGLGVCVAYALRERAKFRGYNAGYLVAGFHTNSSGKRDILLLQLDDGLAVVKKRLIQGQGDT